MSYEPRPGSVAQRAIAHLETLPHGTELMTSALAEAVGVTGSKLAACLEAAVAGGAIFRRQREAHVRAPVWWSLTNNGPSAKREPAFELRKAAGLDDALAQIRADNIEIPRFGAPAPRGAVAGANDDDKGDSGRARRLAGGGDDGRPSGGDGRQDDRAAEHRAGLLRAQPSRAARQGDAEHAGRAADDLIPEGRDSQHVLKAEPARCTRPADATDRESSHSSLGVGPTGVGQAADAASAGGLRIALWSDGTLQVRTPRGDDLVVFSRAEVRQLIAYLDDPAMGVREVAAERPAA